MSNDESVDTTPRGIDILSYDFISRNRHETMSSLDRGEFCGYFRGDRGGFAIHYVHRII